MIWPTGHPLDTDRFILEPLCVDHATEMVAVLAPRELYTFIGGEPPSEGALRTRYIRQAVGHSPDGTARWLNWIIRTKATQNVIGYMQATLTVDGETLTANMAWLITPSAQHCGAATEAATAVLTSLREKHVHVVRALIHPEHHASARVARHLGLVLTAGVVDGESVWEKRTAAEGV
ncbi:GNAT family N-acetyltransferase [Cryobacterium sp. CG_9.6]|uniref:GNAT family N-acetyltransferase n=1 Tax=Cryobacterium sp. CG_9.6 TaxID=2760710 RepID=UPI002473654E|nr:GNAT family N-acetyltransferase [Cryobacterium sp. CG_9.6]MDH6238389.1 RimJ/RimL family protein N-acetyltransferase [Cryobacterium sp. CG_9.6]